MTDFIKKGTVITCPRKGHQIAVANRDIQSGDLVKLSDFDFESGQERVAGERMRCKHELPGDDRGCRSNYFVQGCIHTSEGWKPRDPILETP